MAVLVSVALSLSITVISSLESRAVGAPSRGGAVDPNLQNALLNISQPQLPSITHQLQPYVQALAYSRTTPEQRVADELAPFAARGQTITAAHVENYLRLGCQVSVDSAVNALTSLVPRASARTMPAFNDAVALLILRCPVDWWSNAQNISYLNAISNRLVNYVLTRPLKIPKKPRPSQVPTEDVDLYYNTACAVLGAGATLYAQSIKSRWGGIAAALGIAAGATLCPRALKAVLR